MDDTDEPAYTHKDTVTCTAPIIAEQDDVRHCARGCFYWDAPDPLVIGLHFEIMMNSVLVTPERFPVNPEIVASCEEDEVAVLSCVECDEALFYGMFGALVPHQDDPETGVLLCLMCANDHTGTVYEEALWVLGLDELRGALLGATPADAGAATARVWRLDTDNFQVALREGEKLMFLTISVDRLELLLEAVDNYQKANPDEVESYLEGGLAALQRLANGEENG